MDTAALEAVLAVLHAAKLEAAIIPADPTATFFKKILLLSDLFVNI
ncbi:MAG: hypothetical protein GX670_08850 [Bacteroidales bacterium]|nr:hypothetical protein [Bacteroidales bacterium]